MKLNFYSFYFRSEVAAGCERSPESTVGTVDGRMNGSLWDLRRNIKMKCLPSFSEAFPLLLEFRENPVHRMKRISLPVTRRNPVDHNPNENKFYFCYSNKSIGEPRRQQEKKNFQVIWL